MQLGKFKLIGQRFPYVQTCRFFKIIFDLNSALFDWYAVKIIKGYSKYLIKRNEKSVITYFIASCRKLSRYKKKLRLYVLLKSRITNSFQL